MSPLRFVPFITLWTVFARVHVDDIVAMLEWAFMKSIWKDVLKFLSGTFFVTAGASWYLSWFHIAVPLPFSFFGFTTMSPHFLAIRGFIHFGLFLICFYFGFVKKSAR